MSIELPADLCGATLRGFVAWLEESAVRARRSAHVPPGWPIQWVFIGDPCREAGEASEAAAQERYEEARAALESTW